MKYQAWLNTGSSKWTPMNRKRKETNDKKNCC